MELTILKLLFTAITIGALIFLLDKVITYAYDKGQIKGYKDALNDFKSASIETGSLREMQKIVGRVTLNLENKLKIKHKQ